MCFFDFEFSKYDIPVVLYVNANPLKGNCSNCDCCQRNAHQRIGVLEVDISFFSNHESNVELFSFRQNFFNACVKLLSI